MISSDILAVFQWWLLFFFLSLAVLPFTSLLFHSFFDKGYIFSKSLCVMLLSYLALLVGTLHLLPFLPGTLVTLLVIIAVCNYGGMYLLHKKTSSLKIVTQFFKNHWKIILTEELLFLLGIFFLSY